MNEPRGYDEDIALYEPTGSLVEEVIDATIYALLNELRLAADNYANRTDGHFSGLSSAADIVESFGIQLTSDSQRQELIDNWRKH
jgi:hypothetical protein